MSQTQSQINASVPSFSQFSNLMLDADNNRIIPSQNFLPAQDSQLYFNQEHQRLRDRLIQEILESKQPNAAIQQQMNSSQLFQDNKDYGNFKSTAQKKNSLDARNTEEMTRSTDKQIREEANRMELFVKQKRREEELRRLHQDLYGQESPERDFSQQSFSQPEKNAKKRKIGPPKAVLSRRKNSTSSTNAIDKNGYTEDTSKDKVFSSDTSSNVKTTAPNY